MLNSDEKEVLKRIENQCRGDLGYYAHDFKNKAEKYDENQELKFCLEKLENLGHLNVFEKEMVGNSERWRIKITPQGHQFLISNS